MTPNKGRRAAAAAAAKVDEKAAPSSSPYFDRLLLRRKRKEEEGERDSYNSEKQSKFFRRRPVIGSVVPYYGSGLLSLAADGADATAAATDEVETTGTALLSLSPPSCRRTGARCTSTSAAGTDTTCDDCRRLVDNSPRHFSRCPLFREHYYHDGIHDGGGDSGTITSSSPPPCWERMEKGLLRSVRHLCPQRCYMRAFAPCRDWYALKKEVLSSTVPKNNRLAADALLKGWRCILVCEVWTDGSGSKGSEPPRFLPRTVYVDPRGRRFRTKKQVLDSIFQRHGAGASNYEDNVSNANMQARTDLQPPADYITSVYGEGLPKSVNSPLGLIEELFCTDAWKLLLSTICLNRTTRTQVDPVLYSFLQEWPTLDSFLCSSCGDSDGDESSQVQRIIEIIRPLGIVQKRAVGILRFSKEYHELVLRKATHLGLTFEEASSELSRDEVLSLYQCGEYAYAAYRLFIQKVLDEEQDPVDHALNAYVDYQRGLLTTSG